MDDPTTEQPAMNEEEMDVILDQLEEGRRRFSEGMAARQINDPVLSWIAPMVYLMMRLVPGGNRTQTQPAPSPQGSASNTGNQPGQGVPPTPRPDITHRPTCVLIESGIIREVIKEKWKEFKAPSPEDVSNLFAHYQQSNLAWKGKDHLLEGFLTQALHRTGTTDDDDRAVMFVEGDGKKAKVWNRAVAAWLIKYFVIERVNAKIPSRTVEWGVSFDWIKSTITRVTKHVDYLFSDRRLTDDERQQRNEVYKFVEARRLLFLRRRNAVRNRPPIKHLVEALTLLGEDGMSSDEETEGSPSNFRNIHRHPWRSEAATVMVRYVDQVVEAADATKPRRGNAKNTRKPHPSITGEHMRSRRFKAAHDPINRRYMHVPHGLPVNFYNQTVLDGHPQFNDARISWKDLLGVKEVNEALLRVPENFNADDLNEDEV
ncbi:hypothetical protein E1B28_000157 [Marasmius oreades]|uniref:Uncharacterized protein n=1 Tax=Marasmius oreades TaxID=181124 RepID=A0A9P8AE24_9AGAR|nr:uncharacterized protein E1B28_000157 [Marasmius oreades]KAG7098189.1 hypothetical protein E1B28_000157 [Marasmius oreades]